MLRTAILTLTAAGMLQASVSGQNQTHTVIFVSDATNGEIEQTIALPAFPDIRSPEFSPDGRYVAMCGFRSAQQRTDVRILIVDLTNGELTDLGAGLMPSWSADGNWIAVSMRNADRGVLIRSVHGTEERLIDPEGRGIQWAPDGRRLAYVRRGNLVIYDLVSDSSRELFDADDQPYDYIYWNCKWSPDSRRICFKGKRDDDTLDIAIVTLTDDGAELNARSSDLGVLADIAWNSNEPMILIPKHRTESARLQMFALNPDGIDPPERWNLQPSDRHNGGMSFSRDGKRIVYMSRD